jgi:hypothetical protein
MKASTEWSHQTEYPPNSRIDERKLPPIPVTGRSSHVVWSESHEGRHRPTSRLHCTPLWDVSLSILAGKSLTIQHPRDNLRDLDMKTQSCCLLGTCLRVPQGCGYIFVIYRGWRPDQRRELSVENVYRPPDLGTPFDALPAKLLDWKSTMQTFHQSHTHGVTDLRSSV